MCPKLFTLFREHHEYLPIRFSVSFLHWKWRPWNNLSCHIPGTLVGNYCTKFGQQRHSNNNTEPVCVPVCTQCMNIFVTQWLWINCCWSSIEAHLSDKGYYVKSLTSMRFNQFQASWAALGGDRELFMYSYFEWMAINFGLNTSEFSAISKQKLC